MRVLRAILFVSALFAAVAAYFGYMVLGMLAFTASGSRAIALIAAFVLATVAVSASFAGLLEWDARRSSGRERW